MKPDLVPDYIKYDTPVKKIQTINPKNTLPKNTTNIKNNDIGFIFNIIIVFIILGVSFILYKRYKQKDDNKFEYKKKIEYLYNITNNEY